MTQDIKRQPVSVQYRVEIRNERPRLVCRTVWDDRTGDISDRDVYLPYVFTGYALHGLASCLNREVEHCLPPPPLREHWINRYPSGWGGVRHCSRKEADREAAPHRIECIHFREVREEQ